MSVKAIRVVPLKSLFIFITLKKKEKRTCYLRTLCWKNRKNILTLNLLECIDKRKNETKILREARIT